MSQPTGQPKPGPPYRYTESGDANAYVMEDNDDPTFGIAALVRNGELSFSIQVKFDHPPRKSHIPGHLYFNNMMKWFGNRGTIITSILAQWSNADPEQTTNLDGFNEYLQKHPSSSEEEAAEQGTKTGRWAVAHNYKATKVTADPKNSRGQYTNVRAVFAKQ